MKTPFIIGIAGGSASGKSTFAAKLERALADKTVVLVHMDDYFKDAEQRRCVAAPVNKTVYRDDNHPSSFRLEELHTHVEQLKHEGLADVIVIEGLLTLWDDTLYEWIDLRLFVDCRADERIVRRLKRNMGWGLSFDEVANVYLDMVRYRHDELVEPTKWRADLIINGSGSLDSGVQTAAVFVRSKIGE